MDRDVAALLGHKNRCLEKYLKISVDFWNATRANDFTELKSFEMRRDAALKAIELYDTKIAEAVALLGDEDRTPELSAAVKAALDYKDSLVHQILTLDLKIIGKIEEEKSRLLKEVSDSRKAIELLTKFKSTWVAESGEELDQKL